VKEPEAAASVRPLDRLGPALHALPSQASSRRVPYPPR